MNDFSDVFFIIPGEPRGKGRPRAARQGNVIGLYTDAKTKAYEDEIEMIARLTMRGRAPMVGPIVIRIEIYFGIPESTPKRNLDAMAHGVIVPTKRPDLDNVVKAILDACNGVVFKDDAQVVVLDASKRYAFNPRVEVMVEAYDGHEDSAAGA